MVLRDKTTRILVQSFPRKVPRPWFTIASFSRGERQENRLIEVSHLRKEFGNLIAVDDVSFSLAPGDILGFLGPNGAGKSTTMKMLTGFLRPSNGVVSIWGCDVLSDRIAAQAHIGYLPEGAPCYEEMTPLEFLEFLRVRQCLLQTQQNRQLQGGNAMRQQSIQPVLERLFIVNPVRFYCPFQALGIGKASHRECGTYQLVKAQV